MHQMFSCKPHNGPTNHGQSSKAKSQYTRAFTNVGVDFCGLFQLRESKRRNAKLIKSYVAIFICLAIKAIHIEITFDLSSKGFIQALKRFTGRRGKPSHIFSDNATNFAGADRELKELLILFTKEEHPIVHLAIQGIQWHFTTSSQFWRYLGSSSMFIQDSS